MRSSAIILMTVISVSIMSCQPDPIDPPPPPPGPLTDTTINNISYGSNASQKFDLGLPAGRTSATPFVVVVHGGGWATGDKSELTWLLNGLKQRGFAVANINYRLTLNTPDNYKMQIDDLDSAAHFALRLSTLHTFNGQKFYIVGHSAGGHLSLAYAYTRNADGKIKAAGSLAGPTDLFAMSYYNFNIYNIILQPFLGVPLIPVTTASEQRYKSCSPQYQATATSPPTIFFHGDVDPVVNISQSTSMVAKLNTLGVDKKMITYPLTFHDWWTDATKTANTLEELKTWFNGHP
ncbi:MAG: alpha/beta fold hydrolase [Bacteroidetes bacterium]|nr:alpha/beta fold hydrolase [Bacteroidota bacterium]